MTGRSIKDLRDNVWVCLSPNLPSDFADYAQRYKARGRVETFNLKFECDEGWDAVSICKEIKAEIWNAIDRYIGAGHRNRAGICLGRLEIVCLEAKFQVTLPVDISWW